MKSKIVYFKNFRNDSNVSVEGAQPTGTFETAKFKSGSSFFTDL